MKPSGDRAPWFLAASVALTVALFYLPYGHQIGFPLVLISTVAHEMGHAIAGLLVGGSVDRVDVFHDGAGLAHVRYGGGRLAAAFVSAGGLVGPACAGALCFVFARRPRLAQLTLIGLGALLALALVLFVRNPFGIVYVAALAAVLLAVGIKTRPHTAQLVLIFVAVQLALSVWSRIDYLFVATTVDGARSDAGAMSDALLLPYWVWGALCAAFSTVVLLAGLWFFFRPSSTGSPGGAAGLTAVNPKASRPARWRT